MLEVPEADCGASLSRVGERPDLIVDNGDLPGTAREVRDLLARTGYIFDRGLPVKLVKSAEGGPLKAIPVGPSNHYGGAPAAPARKTGQRR